MYKKNLRNILLRNKIVSHFTFSSIEASFLSKVKKDFGEKKLFLKVFKKKEIKLFFKKNNFNKLKGLNIVLYTNNIFAASLFFSKKNIVKKIKNDFTIYNNKKISKSQIKKFLLFKKKKNMIIYILYILNFNIKKLLVVLKSI